ncbi:HNH endonuclease, partial [Phocaeicola vulgatus]
ARTCELCGKVGPVVMRHVRKLNQLKRKTECDRLMLEKHRKTLVVCEKCYAKIHSHAK